MLIYEVVLYNKIINCYRRAEEMQEVCYDYNPELKKPPVPTVVDFENKTVQFFSTLTFKKETRRVKQYKVPDDFRKDLFTVSCQDGYHLKCYSIEKDNGRKNKPAILYFHGGGFVSPLQTVIFDNAVYYAGELDCKVIMPEYRVLPKHPFPTPLNDCYDALKYFVENASKYGINQEKILVYGDSAGGCLAAAVTHMVRDYKLINLAGQMLIYPTVDNTFAFPSMKTFKLAAWPADSTPSIWRLYLKNGYGNLEKYAVPLKCTEFTGLPTAYVEPQEIDCLRDEAIAYANKLKEAGISTELNIIKGSYHGADADHSSPLIQRVLKHRCEVMSRMFAK